MTVSANGATTTRTTGATAIGMYNIPAANDDDDDFKPLPPTHLRPPSPVVSNDAEITCSLPPPSPEPQFIFVWDQHWHNKCSRRCELEFVMHSTLVMLSMSSNF
jgi:hypothetical protein